MPDKELKRMLTRVLEDIQENVGIHLNEIRTKQCIM